MKYFLLVFWFLVLSAISLAASVQVRMRIDDLVLANDDLATILAIEARSLLKVATITLAIMVMSAIGVALYHALSRGLVRDRLQEEYGSALQLLSWLYDDLSVMRSMAGTYVIDHLRGTATRLSCLDWGQSEKVRKKNREARAIFLAEIQACIDREIKRRGQDSPRPKFLQELRNLEIIVHDSRKLKQIREEERSTGPQGVA